MEDNMTDDFRKIRKYRNRKLYDQKEHRYITLTDILTFCRKGVDFRVEDYNDHDITNDIIVQSVVNRATTDDVLRTKLISYARNERA